MRWTRFALLGMGMATLALASCQNSAPRFTPPPLREEYILPPQDDPRFSNPPVYPKEAMDANNLKKDNNVNEKFGGKGINPSTGKGAPAASGGF
jgi:hypothetical protein